MNQIMRTVLNVATWAAVGFLVVLVILALGVTVAFIWWMSIITHGWFAILLLAGIGIFLLAKFSKK